LRLQSIYDRKVIAALQQAQYEAMRALNGVTEAGVGSRVRDAQIRMALSAISQVLVTLFRSVGAITEAGMEEARIEALATSFDWDDVLLSKVYTHRADREAMKASLMETGRYNLEAMLRHVTTKRISLSRQVYQSGALAHRWVENTISSALARGASPAELAREVKAFIDPNTPGGASYAAKRLSRTEINGAYHAVAITTNEDKPWLVGMQWFNSKSHPERDECNAYAEVDHGLGIGVFPTTMVPGKPHPQCLCYVAPELKPQKQFVEEFHAGLYDAWLAAHYGV